GFGHGDFPTGVAGRGWPNAEKDEAHYALLGQTVLRIGGSPGNLGGKRYRDFAAGAVVPVPRGDAAGAVGAVSKEGRGAVGAGGAGKHGRVALFAANVR